MDNGDRGDKSMSDVQSGQLYEMEVKNNQRCWGWLAAGYHVDMWRRYLHFYKCLIR